MKELRRKFNRWCFVNRNKGIPNLMLYICLGSGLVYLMSLMNGGSVLYSLLAFDKAKILQGQIWRLFTYVFTYQQGGNPILVIISLVCYYSLARAMEQVWGSLRFNLFYLSGILLMDIFAMICSPVSNGQMGTEAEMYSYLFSSFYSGRMAYYLNLTLLIGYATMYPDAQFLIFFVIPVRAWILGLLYLVLNVIELFNLMVPSFLFPHCLFPLVGFGNYILFFGKDVKNLLPFSLRAKFMRKKPQAKRTGTIPFRPGEPKANYTHKCAVCGRTDVSNPELEFRYCSRCAGYHCYCQDHINHHSHVGENEN